MDKIKVVLYRHKYFEDVFLARNWGAVGGNKDTDFYFATKDVRRAINDANDKRFTDWMNRIEGLKAKLTDSREVNFDGYTGVIKKDLLFPVTEFELVELVEV